MKDIKVTENYGILLAKYINENYGYIIKLKGNDKNKFACDYHRMFGDVSIIDILESSLKNEEAKQTIYKFIRTNNLTKSSKINSQIYSTKYSFSTGVLNAGSFANLKRDYFVNNWLEKYDEEKEFAESDKVKPVFFKFSKKDGSILTIDKEVASKVKNILQENDIYPSKCTVENAFKYYANNKLEQYINDLKKTNMDIKKNSIKYGVKRMPVKEDGITLINLIKQSPVKLTHSDKIVFACQYYDTLGNISIVDILKRNINDVELRKPIIKFISVNNMRRQNPNCFSDIKSNSFGINNILTDIAPQSFVTFNYEYDCQNWLEEYDEDKQFEDVNNSHRTINSILCEDGSKFTIDKKTAIKIKSSLIDEGIFPAVCVVKGAFKPTAENDFEQYVKALKKGGIKNG